MNKYHINSCPISIYQRGKWTASIQPLCTCDAQPKPAEFMTEMNGFTEADRKQQEEENRKMNKLADQKECCIHGSVSACNCNCHNRPTLRQDEPSWEDLKTALKEELECDRFLTNDEIVVVNINTAISGINRVLDLFIPEILASEKKEREIDVLMAMKQEREKVIREVEEIKITFPDYNNEDNRGREAMRMAWNQAIKEIVARLKENKE